MTLDEPISLVAYDPSWPALAAEQIGLLERALAHHLVGCEHFGSTSVPGCEGKPIIDILIGLHTWPAALDVRKRLTDLGYEDLGEAGVPGRLYFRRRGPSSFNLAVTAHGGEIWRGNLAIRDLLRRDPTLVQAYVAEKRAAYGDGATTLLAYSKHKAAFMSQLAERAGNRLSPTP